MRKLSGPRDHQISLLSTSSCGGTWRQGSSAAHMWTSRSFGGESWTRQTWYAKMGTWSGELFKECFTVHNCASGGMAAISRIESIGWRTSGKEIHCCTTIIYLKKYQNCLCFLLTDVCGICVWVCAYMRVRESKCVCLCMCICVCVCVCVSVCLSLFNALFYSSPSKLAQVKSGNLVKVVWCSVMRERIQIKMAPKCAGRIILSRHIIKSLIKYSYFKQYNF